MVKIKCPCGKSFKKNYYEACLKPFKGEAHHSWSCPECGQEFMEKVKEPIIL